MAYKKSRAVQARTRTASFFILLSSELWQITMPKIERRLTTTPIFFCCCPAPRGPTLKGNIHTTQIVPQFSLISKGLQLITRKEYGESSSFYITNILIWIQVLVSEEILPHGLTTLAKFIYPEIAQEQFLGK